MALSIPLSFANAQTELATLTSQTANFTFDSDELTQALTVAWNDTYVVATAFDSSTAFVPGTFSYPIPSTITALQGLYYYPNLNNDGTTSPPVPISTDLYEIINGNIQFVNQADWWLNDNYTIYIKGRYKLQTTDNLPNPQLANYVLYLAAETLLNMLLLKKTFVFLTNDTQVAEIVNALKIFSGQVLVFKQALLREFEEW